MTLRKNPFHKISDDRIFIIECYTEMLRRINEPEIISLLNTTSKDFILADKPILTEKIVQSLSIYFQLMTLVEENAATQYRRKMANEEDF